MVLAVDATSSANTTTATGSLTWSHTASGSDRLAIVSYSGPDDGSGVTATYDGVAMTAVPSAEATRANRHTILFYLVAPATGAKNVVLTCTGGTGQSIVGSCVTFTGADQTTPVSGGAGANGSATPNNSRTLTTPTGSYAVMATTLATAAATGPQGSATEYCDLASSGGTTNMKGQALYLARSGASTAIGWTLSSGTSTHATVACVVLEAAAPTPQSDSDTAAATEGTPGLVGGYAQTDTGTATEGTPTLVGAYAEADTGTATEGAAVAAALAHADMAASTEGVPTLVGSYAETDSAAATEGTPTLVGAYAEADTGAATEGTPTLAAAIGNADSATATEGTPTLVGGYAETDTASGSEGTPGLAGDYAETDAATATEGVPTLTAGYAETDTGTAIEGQSVLIVLPPSVEDVGAVTLLRLDRPSATLTAVAGPTAGAMTAVAGPTAGALATVAGPVAGALTAVAGPTAGLIVAVPGPVATLSR